MNQLSNNYKELLDKYVQNYQKVVALIFVTPYDGRYANDQSSESVQTRLYELELAKKVRLYHLADWYQVERWKIQLFGLETDSVHFDLGNKWVHRVGELYTPTS